MAKKIEKGRVSLERALSKMGLASRSEAKSLIENGLVKVHGSVERNPARMVNPNVAHIELNGQKVVKASSRLFVFYKPKGVLTSRGDPEGRKTIYDVLPLELQTFHAVGRLDLMTSGLLLMTNDTKLSNFLTDPQNQVPRSYLVEVLGAVSVESLSKMQVGVSDSGEILKALRVELLKTSAKESRLLMVLTEGKNREVRRLCLALGHEVTSLKRVEFGRYALGELKPGEVLEVEILA